MANSTIPNLVAVTVPAGTDLLGVRQSGDTRDKKLTVTQLLSLAPGGGDVTKVGTPVNNQIGVWTGDGTIEGDSEFLWDGSALTVGFVNAGPQLLNEVATETNPTIVPTRNDPDTGVGHDAADRMALIAGGVTVAHVLETAASPALVIDPNQVGTGAPELAFGVGADTGLRESANVLTLILGGISKWGWDADLFVSITPTGAGLLNEVASATNPTFVPNRSDLDSGIGQNAVDQVSIIGGGVEIARAQEAVGANQFIIAPGVIQNDPLLPSLAFGDGDTGFYEIADDSIRVSLGGVAKWTFTGDSFVAVAGNGPRLMNEGSTATNPTLIPALGDPSTGIGGVTGNISLIIAGVTRLQINSALSNGNVFTGDWIAANGTGPVMIDEAVSSTNPTLVSRRGDEDTGIGSNAADQLSLIAGGVEMARFVEAVGIEQTLILNNDNTGLPDLGSLGDPDTGWHWTTANAMAWIGGGSRSWNFSTGLFFSQFSDGPAMVNVAAASATPTLLPDRADSDTGVGGNGSDKLTLVAGGVVGISFSEVDSGVLQAPDASVGITAGAGGGLVNATLIRRTNNVITTVATTADSVVLPTVFLVNAVVYIKNDGANAADVFPASGDNLGAGVDTAVSLAAGSSISFIATVANNTWTQFIVSAAGGGGDVFKVGVPVLGELGVWTGDGTLEGASELVFGSNTFVVNLSGGDLRLTGKLELQGANRPAVLDESSSHTNATLAPLGNSPGSGLGGQGTSVALVANGSAALVARQLTGGVLQSFEGNQGITAFAGGGQGSAVILRSSYSVIGTVATTGDSVQLPPLIESFSDPYTIVFIKNDGANACDVFPELGHDLGAGVNVAESLPAGSSVSYIATSSTTWTPWIVDTTGGGGGDVTKVGTPVNNQVGIWTGDGTLEGDADLVFDGTILTTGLTGRVRTGVGTVSQAAFGFATEINTGIYRQAAGSLGITLSGTGGYLFQTGSFFANLVGGPQMMREAATATNPTFVPRLSDTDTGIGSAAANQVSIIAGGVEVARALNPLAGDAQLLIDPAGTGTLANPALAFDADGDTGFFSNTDDVIQVIVGAAQLFFFDATSFSSGAGTGPALVNEGVSATNPTLIPRRSDFDTGIGSGALDQLDLVAGGLSCMAVRETAAARQIGFYTTAPISQQTGVAVTAGAIHAALVALGLITA